MKKPVNPPLFFSEVHEPTEFTSPQRVVALETTITLKDLFAAAALQGLLANGQAYGQCTQKAWNIAQQMLEQRKGESK